jgi:S-adenosylmethionine decarboxylase
MFPERQHGPHRGWSEEVSFLDAVFPGGSAYTIGKVNGDHWLLYLTGEDPASSSGSENGTAPNSPIIPRLDGPIHLNVGGTGNTPDYTIEILMSQLAPEARAPFFAPEDGSALSPAEDAAKLSDEIGISDIFPRHMTTLDGYSFTPCGYSSNALINWGSSALTNGGAATATDAPTNGHVASTEAEEEATPASATPNGRAGSGEGYYTIHVTPEEGWSYASFECNVPLALSRSHAHQPNSAIPDLRTVVRRVVDIFRPGRITLTLFISSEDNREFLEEDEDGAGESAVEAAQRAFKLALSGVPAPSKKMNGATNGHHHGAWARYRRTDKINYEFGGYDLAFASFEVM